VAGDFILKGRDAPIRQRQPTSQEETRDMEKENGEKRWKKEVNK